MANKTNSLVTVSVAGKEYTLSTPDDPNKLLELADEVTVRILRIKRETGISPLDCATIAAMELAEELDILRAHCQKLEAQAPKRRNSRSGSAGKSGK